MAWHRVIAIALVLCLLDFGSPRRAHAEMISTDAIASGTLRDHIMGAFNREEVRRQLASYGVSPADVNARVGALTEEEAARIAREIEELPIGADGGSGLAIFLLVLMGIALVVYVVAVVMR